MVKNDERLGNAPLGRLMVSMALPAVAAQVINVLYNIVDRIYIGHIPGYGELALTGVGVTAPILMVISAFSAFAGMGGAPQASIQLGKKNYEGAEKILGTSVAMLLLFSVVLTVVFQAFKTPILYAFGASDNTIVHAREYITIYLAGTVFVQFALGLNTYISGQGNAKIAMLSVLLGAVTNIILDPVLIFGFHMGVRGAALATVISQALSAAWVLRFLTGSNSVIRIRRKQIRLDKKTVLGIGALGISPFIMQSTESLVMITLNTGLQKYGGDMYVGTMSIMSSIMQLIVIPVQGISQGIQPIMSYNFGAGKKDRVRQAFTCQFLACTSYAALLWVLFLTIPGVFANIFSSDSSLVDYTVWSMRIYMAGIFSTGVQISCQQTFMALGQAKISLLMACLRKLVLLIPLIFILPHVFSDRVFGVFIAEPVSDILAAAVTATMLFTRLNRILDRGAGEA